MMDPVFWFLNRVDPILIAPYRWFEAPMVGWWVGTFCLALWAAFLGELTQAVAYRVNEAYLSKLLGSTQYYFEQSMKARAAGERRAYKQINRLANDEFGRSFFLLAAMGMASLWPAFFAAAWLRERFGEIRFALPYWAGGLELSFLAPFVLLYILARFLLIRLKPKLRLRPRASTQM